MVRALTSILCLIAALALGFEAVADPCELQTDLHAASMPEMTTEMPCHDSMMAPSEPAHDMPDHDTPACCCTALICQVVAANAPEMSQPVPGLKLWATPLPDTANSIFFEFEPPPPRA